MDARKSENNFSPQTPYILIVIKSNDGSGGSTPNFQAEGVRGSIPEPGTNGNFLSTSTEALVVRTPP